MIVRSHTDSHLVLTLPLQSLWKAMESLAGAVPKDDHPLFVRPIKEAVATAVEKEKRKRRNAAVAAAANGEPAPRWVS